MWWWSLEEFMESSSGYDSVYVSVCCLGVPVSVVVLVFILSFYNFKLPFGCNYFNLESCSTDEDGERCVAAVEDGRDPKRRRKRSNKMASPYDDKIGGNPIGLVQELCMSRRWPPPTYETEHEEGLPHERQFTIACIVYKYKEVGSGKSKKLAKRQAANKMWLRLKDMPIENNNLQLGLEDDEEITQRMSHIGPEFGDLKNAKISTLNPQHSQKVSQFHKNLKSSYGQKLSELQTVVLKTVNFNFVQFLQEIAAEQQFEVTFVDIEERSVTGKNQCLVQLSTLPVAVCHGTGNSSKEAQSAAALNALEYLKIMTKK